MFHRHRRHAKPNYTLRVFLLAVGLVLAAIGGAIHGFTAAPAASCSYTACP